MVEGGEITEEERTFLVNNGYEFTENGEVPTIITFLNSLMDGADAMIHSYELLTLEVDKENKLYKNAYEHAVQQKQRAINLLEKLDAKASDVPPTSR